MRFELRKSWILALRSGDYVQGVGKFCDVEKNVEWVSESPSPGVTRSGEVTTETRKYCCLGVLADILQKDPQFADIHALVGETRESQGDFNLHQQDMLGIPHGAQGALIALNDSDHVQGQKFEMIADLINHLIPSTS